MAAATAAVVVAIAGPSSAQAGHSWSNYHWARTSNPFTVRLDNNVTSAWTTYLNQASADWTASTVLNTTVVSGSFGSRSSCTPTTGHVEVCYAAYGTTGWLGIASISITTGNHISRAFVKVNDTYFNQAQYNTVAYRRLVMCQEVGHTFGLAHQDENHVRAGRSRGPTARIEAGGRFWCRGQVACTWHAITGINGLTCGGTRMF